MFLNFQCFGMPWTLTGLVYTCIYNSIYICINMSRTSLLVTFIFRVCLVFGVWRMICVLANIVVSILRLIYILAVPRAVSLPLFIWERYSKPAL